MRNIILLMVMLLSVAANAYERTIREDRIWQYVYDYDNMYTNESIYNIYLLKFEGTEEHNGKIYNVLKFKMKDSQDDWIPIALMREDVNRKIVYIVADKTAYCDYTLFGEKRQVDLTDTEIPLYNWGDGVPAVGEVSNMPYLGLVLRYQDFETMSCWYQWDLSCTKEVLYKDKRNFFGIERGIFAYYQYLPNSSEDYYENLDRIIYDRVYISIYVEGIGNVTNGLLNWPCLPYFTASGINGWTYFLCQTDLEGHLTFLPPWEWNSDVVEVRRDDVPADNRKYNLQGIAVENPEQGSIYIQNGEKHIAK